MKRYNYFDDDPEELEPKRRIVNLDFDIRSVGNSIKQRFEYLAHGDVLDDFKQIREMPNLTALFLKVLAFVLFLVFVAVIIISFSHTISAQNKKTDKFNKDAGKICSSYITEYGAAKPERLDSTVYGKDMARVTGLCYARQMDFNNDGSPELMLCYNDGSIYVLEVWGYVGKDFTRLYSEEANSTDNIKDGAWIAFYYKNNKYYICKSKKATPKKVELYALKGDKFKKSSSCDYDYKDNIYSVRGKINADDFETIKLSVIKSSKAEHIVDVATENIDSFGTISMSYLNSKKSDAQLRAEAYYSIIDSRHEKYGKAKVENGEDGKYIDGVALVKLVDFDADSNEELLLVYRKMVKEAATNYYTGERITIEEPAYCVEVYSWNGTVAKKILSKGDVSNYLEQDDVNYIMLNRSEKGPIRICTNTYTWRTGHSFTASSKIYALEKDGFDVKYNARLEDEYGYREYYLDGDYTYRSTFVEKGYEVPKFMNDSEKCDDSFELIYFSGEDENSFNKTVDNTVKEIQKLNKRYSPND